MRCKTCPYTRKMGGGNMPHCWKYGQCPDCHYFGLYKNNQSNHGWAGSRIRGKSPKGTGKVDYHKVRVTKINIDLYCKLSKILRDKSCKPNLVLNTQDNYPANIERKPVLP
jgi:hypothetical protein